jgi:hypothetical protein
MKLTLPNGVVAEGTPQELAAWMDPERGLLPSWVTQGRQLMELHGAGAPPTGGDKTSVRRDAKGARSVPLAPRRAKKATRPLVEDKGGGVGAWIRRQGPPYVHSHDKLRRLFPNVSEESLRNRVYQFRHYIQEKQGGKWSEVNGVWEWHAPAIPRGSGTEPSDATSTETKS